MNTAGLIGLCVICTCVCCVLKRYNEEYALITAFAAGAAVLFEILQNVSEQKSVIEAFFETNGTEEYFSVLWKSAVILIITRFAADHCTDAGQRALSSQVEFLGKAAVLFMALPMFSSLAEIILSLAGG